MSYPKKWNPGKADETWKLMICARDAKETDELISSLVGILTDAGTDTERGIGIIRGMTGEQIMDALLAYKHSAYQSVKAAFRHEAA